MSSALIVRTNGDGERLKSRASSCTANQKTIKGMTRLDMQKLHIRVGFETARNTPETKPRGKKKHYLRRVAP